MTMVKGRQVQNVAAEWAGGWKLHSQSGVWCRPYALRCGWPERRYRWVIGPSVMPRSR